MYIYTKGINSMCPYLLDYYTRIALGNFQVPLPLFNYVTWFQGIYLCIFIVTWKNTPNVKFTIVNRAGSHLILYASQ